VCGELIGKTLFDKTATPAQVILTDTSDTWSLRRVVDVPVVRVAPPGDPGEAGVVVRPATGFRGPLLAPPDFRPGGRRLKDRFARLRGRDGAEPFARIRDAIAEARKMGVTHRAAG